MPRMLSELVELSQERRDASAFEAGALELLQREVGFDVAYFTVRGNEAEPTAVGLERSLVERVVRHGESYLEELLPVKQSALGARGVAVDTEVLGFGKVRETRYFRELVSPAGGRHSLMAYVPWKGEPLAAIMLGRSGGTFSASEALVEHRLIQIRSDDGRRLIERRSQGSSDDAGASGQLQHMSGRERPEAPRQIIGIRLKDQRNEMAFVQNGNRPRKDLVSVGHNERPCLIGGAP